MNIKTRRICCIFITAVIVIALAACYRMLPDQVPVHWGLSGAPEFGHKRTLWGFASMCVIFNILFEVMPYIDPRRKNYKKFLREYNVFCVFMNVYILAFLVALIIQGFRPGSFEMSRFACVMLGTVLLVVGNMMPKFKSNFSSGFKTPWALTDDDNWRKTNRLGGRLLFLAGIIWLLAACVIKNNTVMFVVGVASVMTAVIIPSVMSYLWWKQKEGK